MKPLRVQFSVKFLQKLVTLCTFFPHFQPVVYLENQAGEIRVVARLVTSFWQNSDSMSSKGVWIGGNQLAFISLLMSEMKKNQRHYFNFQVLALLIHYFLVILHNSFLNVFSLNTPHDNNGSFLFPIHAPYEHILSEF